MEHEQIAAQVKKLTGKNNDAAYAALCTLEAESEASAAVCAFWDAFAAMLDDKRTYVRMGAWSCWHATHSGRALNR
ncbi:MAG: hypothetical protein ACLRI7_03515 [Ruthenibacterium lactatiformans]